jgi:hypothetical protein
MTQEQSVQEYPESLLKLLELNPEAEPFVRGYFQNRDKHPEIDLSGEVVQGTIPLFLQWDERWGYETYGSDLNGLRSHLPVHGMVWAQRPDSVGSSEYGRVRGEGRLLCKGGRYCLGLYENGSGRPGTDSGRNFL